MQLQDLSYIPNNQHVEIDGMDVSVEIFGMDNIYTVKPGTLTEKDGVYHSDEILWGDTEKVEGAYLSWSAKKDGNTRVFKAEAKLDCPLRCIKFKLENLPLGTLLTTIDEDKKVDEYGNLFTYPEGWRGLQFPFLAYRLDKGGYLYIFTKNPSVKEHRYFMKKTGEGKMRIDVVYEEDADLRSDSIKTPEIIVGYTDDIKAIYEEVRQYEAKTFGFVPFNERKDVPGWLKDISLVITCHMEAFTGHIFHKYGDVVPEIEKICQFIDPEKVLIYLPGWEGRYYHKYGNYTPDERLGGAIGLHEMVDGLHKLGVKVMAMYGMNIVNSSTKDFDKWGKPAEFTTSGGGHFHCGSVNWDGAHHYDFDGHGNCNVGIKVYQDYMFNQIKDASLEFGFDAAFLDIAGCHVNDPHANLAKGVHELCSRLNGIKKDFLVSGECCYDGIMMAMPLFQSGHTEGWMHYHDKWYEPIWSDYCREFAHLCLGDPYRHSTGVHELGECTETMTPLRKGIIPTLTLVDGTVEHAFDGVKKIIDQANEYWRLTHE